MLQAATLSFLTGLAGHNNKEWFDANRSRYLAAKEEVLALIGDVQRELADELPEIAAQPAKDTLFRIFRDVRFSKDKTPYKTHFGAYLSQGGRKWAGAGFYLHIAPGNSFLASGIWQPEAAVLRAVRQELDYNWQEWQELMAAAAFKKHFKHWEGAVQKTTPKGYDATHPAIDFIKRKSIIATMPVSDEMLQQKGIEKQLAAACTAAAPMVAFLNRAFD